MNEKNDRKLTLWKNEKFFLFILIFLFYIAIKQRGKSKVPNHAWVSLAFPLALTSSLSLITCIFSSSFIKQACNEIRTLLNHITPIETSSCLASCLRLWLDELIHLLFNLIFVLVFVAHLHGLNIGSEEGSNCNKSKSHLNDK